MTILRLAVWAAACAFASLAPLGASAAVAVSFAEVERFTDADDRANDVDRVKQELKAHFEKLGQRYLPGDTELRIEVLDIDLAGNPKRNRHDIRVLTGRADWPCIELAASLAGSAPQKERVCDLGYMRSLPAGYHRDDFLAYEKRMLEEWFRKRFAQGKR